MNCTCCGAQLQADACECRFCGEPTSIQQRYVPKTQRTTVHVEMDQQDEPVRPDHIYVEHRIVREKSDKNRWVLLFLCLFLGRYGAHKFYLGKIGSGVVNFITHGWFYIGWFCDLMSIAFGSPLDAEGRPIRW